MNREKIFNSLKEVVREIAEEVKRDADLADLSQGEFERLVNVSASRLYGLAVNEVKAAYCLMFDGLQEKVAEVPQAI